MSITNILKWFRVRTRRVVKWDLRLTFDDGSVERFRGNGNDTCRIPLKEILRSK